MLSNFKWKISELNSNFPRLFLIEEKCFSLAKETKSPFSLETT